MRLRVPRLLDPATVSDRAAVVCFDAVVNGHLRKAGHDGEARRERVPAPEGLRAVFAAHVLDEPTPVAHLHAFRAPGQDVTYVSAGQRGPRSRGWFATSLHPPGGSSGTDWQRLLLTGVPGGGICHFIGHAGPGVMAVMIRLADGTEALAPAAGGIWWTVAWLDEHDQRTAEEASWRAVAADGETLASGAGLEAAVDRGPGLRPTVATTDARPDDVQGAALRELSAHEHLLQRRRLDTTRDDLEDLLAPTFVEVDPSGRRRDRRYALDARWHRPVDGSRGDWRPTDVDCLLISQDTYLLTYEVLEGRRRTRRATLWQRGPRRWQALHHQATPVL